MLKSRYKEHQTQSENRKSNDSTSLGGFIFFTRSLARVQLLNEHLLFRLAT